MASKLDFSGRNVFVVGGTSGINLGIAKNFAAWGANVAVASRKQEKVTAAVNELNKNNDNGFGVTFDVRDDQSVVDGFQRVAEHFTGNIDILVSGAAGNFPAQLNDMSANAVRSVVEIDLLGTFNVMQASYPYLTKPGASIINISAPQSFLAMRYQSHVCAAKAGVDMVTRSLAMEWGNDGIRINSIVPGAIEGTEGTKRLSSSREAMQAIDRTVPLGRQGTVQDIANVAGWLSSEFSSYISGAVITVDGGWCQSGASEMMAKMAREMDKLSK